MCVGLLFWHNIDVKGHERSYGYELKNVGLWDKYRCLSYCVWWARPVTDFSSSVWTGSVKYEREQDMFTALFILSLLVFGYLMYVLIKPDRF